MWAHRHMHWHAHTCTSPTWVYAQDSLSFIVVEKEVRRNWPNFYSGHASLHTVLRQNSLKIKSVGSARCHHTWREQTAASCPLSFTCVLWQAHVDTHTYKHTQINAKNEGFFYAILEPIVCISCRPQFWLETRNHEWWIDAKLFALKTKSGIRTPV